MANVDHNHHDHHKMMAMAMDSASNMSGMDMANMTDTTMSVSSVSSMSMSDMTTTANQHSMHNMDGMSSDSSMSGMMMVMHSGYQETIVFSGWTTTNIGSFIGSLFAIFFIATAYEGLKLVRDKITKSKLIALRRQMHVQDTNETKLQIEDKDRPIKANYYKEKLLSLEHIIQTILHVLQFAISYFLMLAIMTYNWWICLSILLGIAVGFFLFGIRRSKIDLNEDCH